MAKNNYHSEISAKICVDPTTQTSKSSSDDPVHEDFVLDWVHDRWVIWVGPGQSATDDSVFHRNPSDFRKIFHGAIPFHFHARAIDMSAVAGPGGTDLQAAEAHGAPALVLTSLSNDRLQVDWYRRGGLVVDLGEIER